MTLQEQQQSSSNGTDRVSNDALHTLLTELANVDNSRERADMLFQWLIYPVTAKTFFRYNFHSHTALFHQQRLVAQDQTFHYFSNMIKVSVKKVLLL